MAGVEIRLMLLWCSRENFEVIDELQKVGFPLLQRRHEIVNTSGGVRSSGVPAAIPFSRSLFVADRGRSPDRLGAAQPLGLAPCWTRSGLTCVDGLMSPSSRNSVRPRPARPSLLALFRAGERALS